ncbi:alpha-mannosidase [Vallitalea longa]|uniref:Alpha-mannosidase n=1 Tax=Vallitalea longa TaxID=2936439 RepID=A0A9W5Y983_9FIRM|nr:glycoside hydrolase family 38 C-terminal domain-containing protein [Vallitalea longa]GKX28226.1 alpha-mannosidase [Vallitalea longa]
MVKGHVICHTHWDREWYLTREAFRIKLVRLIDKILDIIDNSPEYVSFMLDGQTIAIEDYVEIRPENQERLMKAIKSGKILSGPWYILPDELLISGESHIRNYIIGSKVADRYGRRMNVGYLPDSFGHPEQMPQIIKGLGMDTMVFWRGTSNAMKDSEFYFQSPYKDCKVLCVHLPCGYGNSARLLNTDETISRIEEMVENLHEKSLTDVVLLMNGSDHISAQSDIVEIVNNFNRKTDKDIEIKLSTMEECVNEIKSNLNEMKTYSGELRYGDRSYILGGTLSTRIRLKQRNHVVQKKMERYLEPIKAIQKLMGNKENFEGYSNYLWKKILENHPHDSICGCSIDEVHTEMETRFNCVEQLEDQLINQSFIEIKLMLDKSIDNKKADAQLMLFEPSQDRLNDYVEIDIDLDSMLVQEVNYAKSIIDDYEDSIVHPDLPESLMIKDDYGRKMDNVILDKKKEYYQYLNDDKLPEIYKVNRVRVGIYLPKFNYGIHLLNVYKSNNKENNIEIIHNNHIENEFYRIEFDYNDCSLIVLDKKNNKVHKGVHKLIDKGDAGDEYTYSWPVEDKIYSLDSNDIQVAIDRKGDIKQSFIINGTLNLPEQLTEDRKTRDSILTQSKIAVEVTLYKGIDRIDFNTVIDNNSKDHRIQVEFPTGVLSKENSSSTAFAVTKRNTDIVVPEDWAEYPQTTNPNHGFVDVSTDEYGLSMSNLGLTEYEAVNSNNQTYVRLTLLRCVGWLSRTDLLTRKGNGGWTIETKDSQCIGRHEFNYGITYHIKDWRNSNAYMQSDRKIHSIILSQLRASDGNLVLNNDLFEFLSNLPKNIRLSTVKISEDQKGIVFRVYSILDKKEDFDLELPKNIHEVHLTDLKETKLEQIKLEGNNIKLSIKPAQIVTVLLEL